jgi:alanine dehydrogenase
MAILLRESDVEQLASMGMAIEAVEEAFKLQGEKTAENGLRRRCRLERGLLHVMSASLPAKGWAGLKSYTTVGNTTRFHVLLYSAEDGALLAVIEGDLLGQLRTGAATGVATKYMARADASSVGIIGTGWQARSQLQAVCSVRPISAIMAYSPNQERCGKFCREMSEKLHLRVEPAGGAEMAVRDKEIVITATSAREPVFMGEWLAEGTHVNAIGSNHLSRQEIDVETVRRSACVVVDSSEQAILESGDLARAVEAGAFYWEDARELGLVVVGDFPGREEDREITLFKSHGIALEDVALAGKVYQAAVQAGLGKTISF